MFERLEQLTTERNIARSSKTLGSLSALVFEMLFRNAEKISYFNNAPTRGMHPHSIYIIVHAVLSIRLWYCSYERTFI